MPQLTRADLKSIALKTVDAWQRHDIGTLLALHTSDAVVESPMYGTRRGLAEIEESYRALFKSFPDMTFSNEGILIDPPQVAIFIKVGGTHMDDFFGLPGTNRHFDMLTVTWVQVDENGLITHERRVYDFTGVLLQVGVLRAKPAKP
ncbi:MAG TPA: ester cyclase [Vicinamibacterales bacterium]|nr:ester cyclase [Vicinamibacterales bacterium]